MILPIPWSSCGPNTSSPPGTTTITPRRSTGSIVYDDHTLAVVSTKAQPDLHLKIGISPTPGTFYHPLGEDFVRKYNWKIVPNTGPYQISDFKKGK